MIWFTLVNSNAVLKPPTLFPELLTPTDELDICLLVPTPNSRALAGDTGAASQRGGQPAKEEGCLPTPKHSTMQLEIRQILEQNLIKKRFWWDVIAPCAASKTVGWGTQWCRWVQPLLDSWGSLRRAGQAHRQWEHREDEERRSESIVQWLWRNTHVLFFKTALLPQHLY